MEIHNELNNAEILTLVVYLLDGTITPVDLEDAAIEAFKLAPKKFSWIKYDDRIDLRIVEYGLRSACRPNMKYLKGSNKHGYMLTQAGFEWAKKIAMKDQSTFTARKSSPMDLIEKEKARLLKTTALEKFTNGEKDKITISDFREFARVNDYFPEHLRKQRYDKIDNVVKDDRELKNVWKFLKSKFAEE
jgi:hypothetical protein